MRNHILPHAILLPLGGALLTGCGGGGGGDADSATAVPAPSLAIVPAPSLAITEENAQPTAQEAFGVMSIVNSSLLGIASSGQANSSSITLKDIALDAVNRMRTHTGSGTSGRLTAQATSTETEPCSYGGTLTYTEVDQDSNPETHQAGDKVEFSFDGCKVSNFVEYNGKQTITLISLTEDSETRLAVSFDIANDLNISHSSDQVSLKGTIQLSMDETLTCRDCFPTTALIGLKSDKIELTSSSERAVIYALDYTNYNDYNSGAWWFAQDNTLDINGQVIRLDTTDHFDGQDCNYPYQGSAMIYGKNSSVKVTARSGNVTDLEIDTNGDGIFDTTKQVGSEEVFEVYCY